MRVVGAVLTGGASRRMGRTKALIEVDRVPMAQRVADALAEGGCEEVVLIGGSPQELAAVGRTVIPDLHPGEGPLGGVLTALAWAASRSHADPAGDHGPTHVVVAACDLAWLDAESVSSLLAVAGGGAGRGAGRDAGRDAGRGAGRDVGGRAGGSDSEVVIATSDRRQPALAVWNVGVAQRLVAMFDDGVRSLNSALDALDVQACVVEARAVTNMNRPEDLPEA